MQLTQSTLVSRVSLTRPSADAVEAALANILASQHFAHSGQLSRFLEFTVTQTLAGNASSLKEYAIGTSVFGRKESFDPRTDGIVRVQAVALRSRLKEYYTSSGPVREHELRSRERVREPR